MAEQIGLNKTFNLVLTKHQRRQRSKKAWD